MEARDETAANSYALLACALLGLYAVFDAAVFYATVEQRALYGAAVLPVLLGATALVGGVRLSARSWRIAFLLLFLCIAPLVTGLLRPGLNLGYLAGDLATIALLPAFLVAGGAVPALLRDGPATRLLLSLLALAAVLAPLIGRNTAGRFEPPPPLLICAVFTALLHGSGRGRIASGLAIAAMAALTLVSGERTTLVLLFALLVGCWILRRGTILPLATAALAVLLLVGSLKLIPQETLVASASRWRLGEIAEGQFDSSLLERFEEVGDVATEMESWSALQWVTGAGHGATWKPVRATVAAQNIQDDGTVHQIHITAVALTYRYGLAGMLAFLLFLGAACAPFLTRGQDLRGLPPERTFFRLALATYLLLSMTTAVLVDPLLSLAIAGSLHWADRRRSADMMTS
jgi:hypothetical protein